MSFNSFIKHYREQLRELFRGEGGINEISLERGLPDEVYEKIMDCNPLQVWVPEEYGGLGGNTGEAMSMLEASGYESLALSLMMGINGALFIQPVVNYAEEETRKEVLDRFMNDRCTGGLMITEPDYGSDALQMQTACSYDEEQNAYHVKGTKHWAGLTGMADYWLITAREEQGNGNGLSRDIDIFIHDSRRGGIDVKEYYKNLGLYMLPYGRNEIDITVPESYKLKPKSIGIKMMLDILHRSRLQFPGMGIGYMKRLLDEAVQHCKERFVGGKKLLDYDQVKRRISGLQMSFTVCSALCAYTSKNIPLSKDVSNMSLEANAIKTVTTDLMQEAAQSVLQLMGAKGYRLDHIAGRSVIDSRPFQIFEGSNDILYQQITESVLKQMRKLKVKNLSEYLSDYELTHRSADRLDDLLDFEVDHTLVQRKMVDLGRAISRIISMDFTIRLGEKGFNQELISNALKAQKQRIETLLATFKSPDTAEVVEHYEENSKWIRFV